MGKAFPSEGPRPGESWTSLAVGLRPVGFCDVSKGEIVEAIASASGPAENFVGLNAHSVYLAEQDPAFREALFQTRRFCDGFGVHLLCVAQGIPRPKHRNTPTDFMWPVFARLHAEGKTVFLLGDEPGVAEAFAGMLNQRHPGLAVGSHHGFFSQESEEERLVIGQIVRSRPHLLCVGMGQPRQEKWAYRLRAELNCRAVLHIGASMAFAIGARRRGPAWATGRGLEWLFRVLYEPKRMFSRYFVEIPRLLLRALQYRRVISRG